MRRLSFRTAASVVATTAALSWAPAASAYCRTTTCNPNVTCGEDPEECCIPDRFGCDMNGVPILWPTSCVSFNQHEAGSEKRGISSQELSDVLDEAYDKWLGVDCGGGAVSLAVDNRGDHLCGTREFNEGDKDRNANVWLFRDDIGSDDAPDDEMEIDASTLAIAVVSFNYDTAEIYDVDVELNSGLANFTVGDNNVKVDLASVVTHEAGHFLGLDHSAALGATMGSGYTPGSTDARSLDKDDEQGICAVYPKDRFIAAGNTTCEPRGKYHKKCEGGCSVGGRFGSDEAPQWPLALVLGALGVAWTRRRLSA